MSAIPASTHETDAAYGMPVAVVCKECGTENVLERFAAGQRIIRDSCELCGHELTYD
jgi:ribosomal protein S27E